MTGMKHLILLLSTVAIGWVPLSHPQKGGNLARRGEATQSSYWYFMHAGLAIDGINHTDYNLNSCAHTEYEYKPWWRLDLKRRYKIGKVVIVNRMDCCSERLLGAEVRVGNSGDHNKNPICGKVTDVSEATITLCCNGMEGRYVSVVIPGKVQYLTLCEVEVYGYKPNNQKVNVARLGEATQSSDWVDRGARLAIDGVKNTNYFHASCSHTEKNNPAWWRLDLKENYKIATVLIVNRMDDHSDRLLGAEVHIGNATENNNTVCGNVTDISKASITVSCKGILGRYITVVIPGREEYLTLCEVEVYVEQKVNLAKLGKATQSSDWISHGAQLAIDGVKYTDFSQGSCSHTKNDNPAWWRLDLMVRYKVDTVVLVNRMDADRERLLGAEIRVGDSANNNNPICGTVTSISQDTITLCCNGMEGRYVSVVIPGREEYLSLCEVEVFGTEYANEEAGGATVDDAEMTHLFIHPRAHTNTNNMTWWQLDLRKRYMVQKVVIANRMEEHSKGLMGAEIRVGDSADNNNPICGTIREISNINEITVLCEGRAGYYVSVVVPHSMENLGLSEVQVYGEKNYDHKGVNVARQGEAVQSSTYLSSYPAKLAIDGILQTDLSIRPCARTNNDNPAWWIVDLKAKYEIEFVVIRNWLDNSRNRQKTINIYIGNLPDNSNPAYAVRCSGTLEDQCIYEWCDRITDFEQDSIASYCKGMKGRYVRLETTWAQQPLILCEVEVYGEKVPDNRGVNLARWGEAHQSSIVYSGNRALQAIDGIHLSDRHHCALTGYDNPAWWRLDLKKRYKVQTVIVVNRIDGNRERLMGAEIQVGDAVDNNNPVCGTITKGAEAIITLSCGGMEGRYVSVVIPGREEYLHLCEVEVYGEESTGYRDLQARSGDIRQSSVYRAEHRGQDTSPLVPPCTRTGYDNPAWWQLDLKKRYKVHTVIIENRMDEYSERLLGAEIRIGDLVDNNNTVCRNITDVSQANITLYCNGMEGRYVSVVIPGRRQYLQLCEVEVYGEESINQEGINLARSGEVSQSSTRSPEYGAERAIDGNKDTNNYSQPCTQTKKDSTPWWQLDLMRTYRIGAILIVSRGDLLLGAEIRVGDSIYRNNPKCATITEIFQDATTVYCYGMEGRYVSVILPKRSESLSLCEVQVYGSRPYTGH